MAKCPKCERVITQMKLETIRAANNGGRVMRSCAVYSCAQCETVLSIENDPDSLVEEVASAVIKKMERR